ncbi:hypothetical protein B566_EDAN016011 [Ephemera danica]|nr:hypothetical protein B566_EDAN016011 [Ephemera danica]
MIIVSATYSYAHKRGSPAGGKAQTQPKGININNCYSGINSNVQKEICILTLSHSMNTGLITGDPDIISDSQPGNFDQRCTFLTQDVGDENTSASVENIIVPHEVYKSWSLQICAVFPKEKPELWYNPGVSIPIEPAQPQPPVDISITIDEQQILSNLGQEQTPTTSVLQAFSETYDARQKSLRQLTISEYFSKFPVYHHKDGYKIILNDFRKQYPQQSGNLLDKWGAWADEIIRVANERKLVERILFAGEKRRKPPRADIQKSFILLCKETDLLEHIIALRERNYIQHQTLQPFLIVVGTLESPLRTTSTLIDATRQRISTGLHFIGDRKRFGLQPTLRPVIDSLRRLSHKGIDIKFDDGEEVKLYFTLAYF